MLHRLVVLSSDIMKIEGSYIGLATRCFRGKSWDLHKKTDYVSSFGSYVQMGESDCRVGETCFNILQLPDDIWLLILSHLQILDVVR